MSRDDLFASSPEPLPAGPGAADQPAFRHQPLAARMRPRNLLSIEMKRQARFGLCIPLFPAQNPDDVLELFTSVAKVKKISLTPLIAYSSEHLGIILLYPAARSPRRSTPLPPWAGLTRLSSIRTPTAAIWCCPSVNATPIWPRGC